MFIGFSIREKRKNQSLVYRLTRQKTTAFTAVLLETTREISSQNIEQNSSLIS